MKIYTRSGDGGRTSLFSGERVSKDDERIEAYGDLDELNSALGVLAAMLASSREKREERSGLLEEIGRIQEDLLVAGGWLATRPGSPAGSTLTPFSEGRAARLETAIDGLQAQLPPLTRFLFPGGHLAAAWCHMARCICRRAERRAVRLLAQDRVGSTAAEAGGQPPQAPPAGSARASTPSSDDVTAQHERILAYLNRLSDYLFVLARTCNRIAGEADRQWQP